MGATAGWGRGREAPRGGRCQAAASPGSAVGSAAQGLTGVRAGARVSPRGARRSPGPPRPAAGSGRGVGKGGCGVSLPPPHLSARAAPPRSREPRTWRPRAHGPLWPRAQKPAARSPAGVLARLRRPCPWGRPAWPRAGRGSGGPCGEALVRGKLCNVCGILCGLVRR